MIAEKRIANLDGLRCMAAAVVAICHFDIIKGYFGLERTGWRFFNNAAQIAVTFFFVLSGFLITYLLLKEKLVNPAGHFSIRKFYGKRIRRIWPLYYLLLLLCFFVFRNIELLANLPGKEMVADNSFHSKRFLGYLFFLPNYTEYVHGPEFYIGQTWSLAVEEFFYLFFPIGLYFASKKNVLTYLVLLAAVFLILSAGVYFFNQSPYGPLELRSILFVFFDKYRIYAFALGGVGAWLLLHPEASITRQFSLFQKNITAWVLLFLLAVLVTGGITFSFLTQQVYAVLVTLFIYATVATGTRFSFLNHRVMIYLGKISYGIYMLHPVAIVLLLKLAGVQQPVSLPLEILLATGAILLTILLAAISYELFEKFFLGRKRKPVTG